MRLPDPDRDQKQKPDSQDDRGATAVGARRAAAADAAATLEELGPLLLDEHPGIEGAEPAGAAAELHGVLGPWLTGVAPPSAQNAATALPGGEAASVRRPDTGA